MTNAEEIFDYLRDSMLKRECDESEFEWLGRMKGAYARQGFLNPRQTNVLVNLSDDLTAEDIRKALKASLNGYVCC